MKTLIKSTVLLATLTACTPTLPPAPQSSSVIVNTPDLNVVAEAEIGESMISISRRSDTPAIQLATPIKHEAFSWTLTIQPGILPLYSSNRDGSFYRVQGAVELSTSGLDQPNSIGGVFVPSDASKPTEVFWISGLGTPVNGPQPGIQFTKTTYRQNRSGGFSRELIYSGIVQGSITLQYREFIDDMARPAFSQELKYDISQDKIIGFHGARFEVLKANNTNITYKTLKYLN